MQQSPRYSVVIPVRNEEADVAELARLVSAELGANHEIIFIDDGSSDRTWERLRALHEPDRVRLIRFRRNFGKAAALMAGFAATRGEIVFTMDGDLQDDPREMGKFLARLEEGFDLVSGWKRTRHDPITKTIPSRLFNFVTRKATGVALHDMNCGFKCFRGELARRVRIHGELHRFIPALAASDGYRIAEVEVRHSPRRHGRSKYGFSRLFKGLFDLITVLLKTRFRDRPAHGFGFAASGLLALGVVLAALEAGLRPPFSLALPALFFSLSAVIVFSAGWVAEVAVSERFVSNPLSTYSIEERLD